MQIEFKEKGDLKNTKRYLNHLKKLNIPELLEEYANKGLEALKTATPVRTGLTASSWAYKIEQGAGIYRIIFSNTNINRYVNIAIILDTGHATGTGGWVEGLDYINPALQPIFEDLAKRLWMEVSIV